MMFHKLFQPKKGVKIDISHVSRSVVTFSNDGSEFAGSIYHKVNKDLEAGVNLSWASGNNATTLGLGAKYKIDKDSSLVVSIHV